MSNPVKIYGLPLSQNVRKVLAVANYVGVDYELEPSQPQADEVKAVNPCGRIPAMDDNGFRLGESNAICRYLAQKAKSDLYPEDLQAAAEVDYWLAWDCAHWTPSYQPIQFERMVKQFFGMGDPDEDRVAKTLELFARESAALDQALEGREWLVGDKPTLADFSVGAGLTYATQIGLPLDNHDNIAAWNVRLGTLDAWKSTAPN